MSLKLEGKPVVQFLRENIKKDITELGEHNITPTILIIRVGEREDDVSYERSILKNCELLAIKSIVKTLPVNVTMEELTSIIEQSNKDNNIHGIMLFRPLPAHIDLEVINNTINPIKDIDCMSPVNLEKIFEGNSTNYAPCTAQAVIEILKYYNIPLKGANIAVVGRSLVVGKPLAMLLLDENATVTLCHSKTRDMKSITRKADIVVAAIGRAKFMNEEYFDSHSIVIDVGINDDGNGNICGDVDFEGVFNKVNAINPALGGVGVVTTTLLLNNVVTACKKLNCLK